MPGFSPATQDLRSVEKVEKGHGRLEKRTLTARRGLTGYVEWPYAEQVFKSEREFQQLNTGKRSQEVAYGMTSLMTTKANAAR